MAVVCGLAPRHGAYSALQGATFAVTVLKLGFQFEGVVYPSLSAVAKAITGSHCSGRLFFRLNGKGGAQ
jgi:hypothetical protein